MKKLISVIITLVTAFVSFSFSVCADKALYEFGDYLLDHIESYSGEMIDISQFVIKNGWTQDETHDAVASFYYSHPELFYVHNGYNYTTIGNSVTSISFKYDVPRSSLAAVQKKVDDAAKKAIEGITDDMSDVEKALYVHDYLILNCRYNVDKGGYTAYNCFVDKLCVCQGYTLAYEYILTKYLGIECTAVYSDAANHIWNYVKIGNNWYHVDLTLDDPYDSFNGKSYDRHGYVSHDNFLLSDTMCKKMSTLHKNWKICDKLPAASDNSFDNAFWRNIYSKICFSDGYCYYLAHGGMDYSKRVVNVCRYDKASQKRTTIATLKCTWYARRSSTYPDDVEYGTKVYNDIFSSIEYMNGKLYFNSNKSVYSYNFSTKKVKKIYTLDKGNEMQIFGMVRADNKLRLVYRKDLTYSESFIKLAFK